MKGRVFLEVLDPLVKPSVAVQIHAHKALESTALSRQCVILTMDRTICYYSGSRIPYVARILSTPLSTLSDTVLDPPARIMRPDDV
jgi:hypothetical protein